MSGLKKGWLLFATALAFACTLALVPGIAFADETGVQADKTDAAASSDLDGATQTSADTSAPIAEPAVGELANQPIGELSEFSDGIDLGIDESIGGDAPEVSDSTDAVDAGLEEPGQIVDGAVPEQATIDENGDGGQTGNEDAAASGVADDQTVEESDEQSLTGAVTDSPLEETVSADESEGSDMGEPVDQTGKDDDGAVDDEADGDQQGAVSTDELEAGDAGAFTHDVAPEVGSDDEAQLSAQVQYSSYAVLAKNGRIYRTDSEASFRDLWGIEDTTDLINALNYITTLYIASDVTSFGGEVKVAGCGDTSYNVRSYMPNIQIVTFMVGSTGKSNLRTLSSSAFYGWENLVVVRSLGKTKITSIPDYCFEYCSNLASVVLPSTCKTIGNYAFGSCSSLSNVTLTPGLNTIGYYAFYDCDYLVTVDIPKTVTEIRGGAFSNCDNLSNAFVRASTPPSLTGYGFFSGTPIASMSPYADEGGIFVPKSSISSYLNQWSEYENAIRYIAPRNVNEATSWLTQTVYNWTGKAIQPTKKVNVTYNGRVLVRGTDYWLSYKDNVNMGIARVLIHGKGNYTGVKTLKFRIGGKTVDLPNGYFEICKSLKANTHISVNSANANVNARNYAANQRFQIVKCENGAYRIVNVGTGKALGVTSAGNVTESAWANKWAQQWIPEKVTNTSWIQWRNHKTGKFLCMPNTYSPGTNVATATSNGKGSQQWLLRKAVPYVSDGNDRRIALAAAPTKIVSPSNNNTSAGTNANLSTKVNKDNDYYTWMCQDMVFHRNANGFYVIEDYLSGCVLQANSEGNVLFGTKQGSTGALAQQWALMQYKTSAGEVQYYIINAKYAKALGTRDKSTAYHANAMIFPRSKALRWVFVR